MSSYSSKRAAFVVALIFFAGVAVANLPVARIASAAASFLTVVAHDSSLAGEGTNASPLTIAGNGVGTNHLANNSVTSAKIPAGQVVKKINGLTDDIFLVAGSNISIGQTGNTLTIESLLALTSVSHNGSLIGDGTAATPLGIANAGVGTLQLADASVNSSKIASGEIVKGINGLKDNITLAAGANITITPNGNTLTVASTAGGSPSTTPYVNPLQVATLHWRRHHQIGIQLTLGQPTGPIAFDGANMWVPLTDGTVAKIRAHDLQILATYSLPGIGAGMAYDGAHMWIAISDSNLVVRMRISDGVIVNQITVSPNPRQVMFDGHIIWVAGLTDVTQIVLGQNHGSPYAYNAPPTGLAVDGVFRWATLTDNTVVKFFSDQDPVATINVGNNPQALAFDGAHMWIANAGSNTVTKIRVSDNAVLGSFNIGSGPSSLAFDGDNMWVANWGTNSLVRFRTSDGAILHTYHQLGPNIRNLAFDGVSIWVTHATGVTKLS